MPLTWRNASVRWIGAILLGYTVGFCVFYPSVLASTDEARYVEQAVAFAAGRVEATVPYPVGTSLLQTPFVLVGGWRAAAWASVLSMTIALLVIARWLRDAGYAPGFAVLFLAYAPTLVMARVASSDVPSAAIVALFLWLFWRGECHRWNWFVAGALAGISVMFRETNLLIFLPFFVTVSLRRTGGWRRLGTGGLVGLSVAIVLSRALFGAAFPPHEHAGWSLAAIVNTAPVYGAALLVLVPGGLLAVIAYRGRYRGELMAAVALYLVAYLFYNYSGQDSGAMERVAAAGRYMIPLMPLITMAWADAMSRRFETGRSRMVAVSYAAVLAAAIAIHPFMHSWSAREALLVREIATTVARGAVVAEVAQQRYFAPFYGDFTRFWISDTPASEIASVTQRYSPTYIVLVSRSDRSVSENLATVPEYLAQVQHYCQLDAVHDRQYGTSRRLQMWRVYGCHRRAMILEVPPAAPSVRVEHPA